MYSIFGASTRAAKLPFYVSFLLSSGMITPQEEKNEARCFAGLLYTFLSFQVFLLFLLVPKDDCDL